MKKAFTLSEVLITLSIIGVVAAMTLPLLVQNYQKKQTVTKLKKVYTNVMQAIKLSEIDNGSLDYWNYSLPSKDFYNIYLKKYLLSAEEISIQSIENKIQYKYLNGSLDRGGLMNNRSYVAKLLDGSFIYIDGWYSTTDKIRNIMFDINGYSGPNVTGKDVFWFFIIPNIGLKPSGNLNSSDCYKGGVGYTCSFKIINDGWEMKKDYPW